MEPGHRNIGEEWVGQIIEVRYQAFDEGEQMIERQKLKLIRSPTA